MLKTMFLVLSLVMTAAVNAAPLKSGAAAPDFTLPSTAGQPVKLSSFRGKTNVVLAFFPAAFTGG